MTDTDKPGPVDNSRLDAGVAARESMKAAETHEVAEEAAEIVEADQEEVQTPEDTATSDKDAPRRSRKKGSEVRIDELTKEKYDERRAKEEATRERDYWKEQAIKSAKPETPSAPVTPPSNEEPTLESCDFDPVEYQRRFYKWAREQERTEERNTKAQEQWNKRMATVAEKEQGFRAEHPDYDQIMSAPHIPLTQMVTALAYRTDDPPAVGYYLATHLEELTDIAQMEAPDAARAIGRIEAKLSAPPASNEPSPLEPKTVTRAPAPVTTLSGSPAVRKPLDDLSMRDYAAQRKKDRAAKGLPP